MAKSVDGYVSAGVVTSVLYSGCSGNVPAQLHHSHGLVPVVWSIRVPE